jgi:hypothetical protein
MAHFAKLDQENNVLSVHVVNNEVIRVDGIESEQAGIDFLTSLHGHSLWKQTSYNKQFRSNYAIVGGVYDYARDAFLDPKPYPSWVLNEETMNWQAPTDRPDDQNTYNWSETTQSWVLYPDDKTYSIS